MPMPASASTEPPSSPPVPPASERHSRPVAASAIASSAVRSSPLRCASQGVPTPARAKAAVGTMPSSPATVAPKPNCAPSTSSRGVIEVTAVRRLNADSTMPASTSARPGRRAALAWGWVWRMSIGSGIRCMAAQGHR